MRICLSLHTDRTEQRIPLSHLDLLRDWLVALRSGDDGPVAYSDLRVPTGQRRIDTSTGELVIGAGTVQWWLASPYDALLRQLMSRLRIGAEWELADARFRVGEMSVHYFPEALVATVAETPDVRFTCWTPIVANGMSGTETASDAERDAYETRIRRSLLDKYKQVYRALPENDRVRFQFDADYLARHPRGGSKRILWRGRSVSGVLAPFTLAASPEMLRVAWECGVGDRAEKGFGFAEILP